MKNHQFNKNCQKEVPGTGLSTSRAPKSPWMRFASLFEAISDKISSKDMDLVNTHYELFRVCHVIYALLRSSCFLVPYLCLIYSFFGLLIVP